MEADSGIELKTLRVDGGAVKNNFLMKFQSDILDVPEERPVINETTARCSILSWSCGWILENQDEIKEQWHMDKRFEPTMEAKQAKSYMLDGKAIEATKAFK